MTEATPNVSIDHRREKVESKPDHAEEEEKKGGLSDALKPGFNDGKTE